MTPKRDDAGHVVLVVVEAAEEVDRAVAVERGEDHEEQDREGEREERRRRGCASSSSARSGAGGPTVRRRSRVSSRLTPRSGRGRRPRAIGRSTAALRARTPRSSAQPVSWWSTFTSSSVTISTRPCCIGRQAPARRRRRRRAAGRSGCGRRRGPAADRLGGALGHDLATADHRDTVGQVLGLLHVVGREHDRGAAVGQRPHHVPRIPAGAGVEARRRLVEEQQLGRSDEPETDVEPPLLATREGLHPGAGPCPAGPTSSITSSTERGCG